MGVLDISVRYEGLHREPNGNVKGKVVLKLSGNVLSKDYDFNIDARNFDFPKGGEAKDIYNQDFGVKVFGIELAVNVKATVHEHTAGQCCIQGRVEAKSPIDVGKDLDPNCQPIPESSST